MNKTTIGWADRTWNPVTGCTRRCSYCYAHRLAKGRLRKLYLANSSVAPGCDLDDPFAPRMWADRLDEPFSVKTPSKVFVCSMGELFDPHVPWPWIEEVLATAGEAHWHTFQFLTKQPSRAAQFTFPTNAWAGVTIENGGLIPQLRLRQFENVKAPVRFLSFEPLTGPTTIIPEWVNWVIIGAMTGSKNQVMGAKSVWQRHTPKRVGHKWTLQPPRDWVQKLIDCADAMNIPVFLKDNLGWPEVRRDWPD